MDLLNCSICTFRGYTELRKEPSGVCGVGKLGLHTGRVGVVLVVGRRHAAQGHSRCQNREA